MDMNILEKQRKLRINLTNLYLSIVEDNATNKVTKNTKNIIRIAVFFNSQSSQFCYRHNYFNYFTSYWI